MIETNHLESQGVPRKTQVTRATYDLIQQEYPCEANRPLAIKGKGEMETWFLTGKRD